MTRLILLSALLLSACATTSDDIGTANIPSSVFADLSCSEMKTRSRQIDDALANAEDDFDGGAQFSNLVMLGVPGAALDAVIEPGEEIAQLRGQQIAIRQAFRERGCVA